MNQLNTVYTATYKKAQAKKHVMNFVNNWPYDVLPFSSLENEVYYVCKDMTTVECFRLFARVLRELGIRLGDDYIKR